MDRCSFLRDICSMDCLQNLTPLGGLEEKGDAIIVEIDESYFFSREYNRYAIFSTESKRKVDTARFTGHAHP